MTHFHRYLNLIVRSDDRFAFFAEGPPISRLSWRVNLIVRQ